MADLNSALEQCDLVLRSDPYNQQAIALRDRIQRKREMIIDKEREATRKGMIADVGAAWRPVYAVDSVEFKNLDGGTMKTPIGGDPERMAQLYIDLNFSTYSPRASVNAILEKYADEHAGEFAVEAMRYISQNIVPYCVGEPIYSIDITVTYWITMQQVMWNGMSPEDALADCAEKINTYLKNNEYWQYCP